MVDPALLQRVFAELAAEWQSQNSPHKDKRLEAYRAQLMVVDGTLWRALPRMAWALWRYQHGKESALKLHLKFNLLEEKPVGALLTNARSCERAVLRNQLVAGEFTWETAITGKDYALFSELERAGCSMLRLRRRPALRLWKNGR